MPPRLSNAHPAIIRFCFKPDSLQRWQGVRHCKVYGNPIMAVTQFIEHKMWTASHFLPSIDRVIESPSVLLCKPHRWHESKCDYWNPQCSDIYRSGMPRHYMGWASLTHYCFSSLTAAEVIYIVETPLSDDVNHS